MVVAGTPRSNRPASASSASLDTLTGSPSLTPRPASAKLSATAERVRLRAAANEERAKLRQTTPRGRGTPRGSRTPRSSSSGTPSYLQHTVSSGQGAAKSIKKTTTTGTDVVVRENISAPVKVQRNGSKLRSLDSFVDELGANTRRVEYLYLRSNCIRSLAPLSTLASLKILDVSENDLSSLAAAASFPRLMHLHASSNGLSSLASLPSLTSLKVLSISHNSIVSLTGMAPQPSLQVLHCSHNCLTSLLGLPVLPNLSIASFRGNPLAASPSYVIGLLLTQGRHSAAERVDGKPITSDDRTVAWDRLPWPAEEAALRGWVPRDPSMFYEEMAETMLHVQQTDAVGLSLRVTMATVNGTCVENDPLRATFAFENVNEMASGSFLKNYHLLYEWYSVQSNGQTLVPIQHAHGREFVPSLAHVGYPLKVECTVLPLSEDKIMGAPLLSVFAFSRQVEPALPMVRDLCISGDVVEGEQLSVTYSYFGGVEGEGSRIRWYRCSPGVPPRLILDGPEKLYKLSIKDVGCSMCVEVTPQRSDGVQGDAVFLTTGTVAEARPHLLSLRIEGEAEELETLSAKGDYCGGKEGETSYQWVRICEDGQSVEVCREKQYVLTFDDVGCHMRVVVTPRRHDGVAGPTQSVTTPSMVYPFDPTLHKVWVEGSRDEGSTLTGRWSFRTGEVANSVFAWNRQADQDCLLKEIEGTTGCIKYVVGPKDVGQYVVFRLLPISSSGRVGRPMQAAIGPIEPVEPQVHGLEMKGSAQVGKRLSVSANYLGGIEGNSLVSWWRVGGASPSPTGDVLILEGSRRLDVGVADLGYCLKAVYTPIRDDGVEGEPAEVVSDVVSYADLDVSSLTLDGLPPIEGRRLTAVVGLPPSFHEGACVISWARVPIEKSPSRSSLSPANGASDSVVEPVYGSVIVSEGRHYTPTLSDVGFYIKCVCEMPAFSSLDTERPKHSYTTQEVVLAGAPSVSGVSVSRVGESNRFLGSASYFGGVEGSSSLSWIRVYADGRAVPIQNAKDFEYSSTTADLGCRLQFRYLPVRSDGSVGAAVSSPPTEPIRWVSEILSGFVIRGIPKEGEKLSACPEFKGEGSEDDSSGKSTVSGCTCTYEWLRVEETGQSLVLTTDSNTYFPVVSDIGSRISCVCRPTDPKGVPGRPIIARTTPIVAAEPVVRRIRLSDGVMTGVPLKVSVEYGGGEPAPPFFRWFRVLGDGIVEVQSGTKDQYTPCADDVSCRLRVECTPVRCDGVRGPPQAVSSDPVSLHEAAAEMASALAKGGCAQFNVLDQVSGQKELRITLDGLSLLDVGAEHSGPVIVWSKVGANKAEVPGAACADARFPSGFTVQTVQGILTLQAEDCHQRDAIVTLVKSLNTQKKSKWRWLRNRSFKM